MAQNHSPFAPLLLMSSLVKFMQSADKAMNSAMTIHEAQLRRRRLSADFA